MKELAFVLLAATFGVILLFLRKGRLSVRWLRKREEQGFTDPEQLAELLDEWNRKHRPDLWASGGDWPADKGSKAEYQEVPTITSQGASSSRLSRLRRCDRCGQILSAAARAATIHGSHGFRLNVS